MEFRHELDNDAYRFILTGGLSLSEKMPEAPNADWILSKNWGEITRLGDIPALAGFHEYFYKPEYLEGFKRIYDSLNP